jgi:hypothetical protein
MFLKNGYALILLLAMFAAGGAHAQERGCTTGRASIPANADWTQISPNVTARHVLVSLRAKGTWHYCPNGCSTEAGGITQNPPTVTDVKLLVLPTATVGTLIGKIGTDPQIRKLGASAAFVAWADGPLYGKMNDLDAYHDNSGSIDVTYEICPAAIVSPSK